MFNLLQLMKQLKYLVALPIILMCFPEAGQTQSLNEHQNFEKSFFKPDTEYVLKQIRTYLISTRASILPDIELINSDYVNAFAVAPNAVIMSSGLVKVLTSRSELAFVVGHELGHLLAQESFASLLENSSLKTIDQELSADLFAINLMVDLGYNPYDSIALLEKLAINSTSSNIIGLRIEHLLTNLQ